VVLDNRGFSPEVVSDSCRLLSNAGTHYLFVSMLWVYADRSIVDQDESGAVGLPGVPEGRSPEGPFRARGPEMVSGVSHHRSPARHCWSG